MADITATVTVTLPRDWLRNNHLHLENANNERLALVSRHGGDILTKPLELFTQWRLHSYELLPYTVVDTAEADNHTELLQTVILELRNKIQRMMRPEFAGEQAPPDDVSVSQGLVENAVNRARDRMRRNEDTAGVHDLMQRLNL